MRLSELLNDEMATIDPAIVITGLSQDSRTITPGDLFLLRPGRETDTLRFVEQAMTKGAVAILYDDTINLPPQTIPTYAVKNCASRLGEWASRFYHYPSRQMALIGVTGTNGKTSICHFVAQMLAAQSQSVGVLGTLGTGIYPDLQPSQLTSAEPITLQKSLHDCREASAETVVMEVSSHALDQRRIKGCEFDTVIFANLSRDHLDYHGTMAAYFATKCRLFSDYHYQYSVINVTDEYGQQLWQQLSPALKAKAWLLCEDPSVFPEAAEWFSIQSLQVTPKGMDVEIDSSLGCWQGNIPLYGSFNVTNALLAVMSLASSGYPVSILFDLMTHLTAPPGRLQVFRQSNGGLVVVDFAHTPDGLTAVLSALKPYVTDQLICVFGCGGDRDKGKRPLMAEAVERLADRIIVTQDNSRSESPAQIFNDIMSGFSHPERVTVQADRFSAIQDEMAKLQSGDCLLIAGKGHETVQDLGQGRQVFSDVAVVKQLIQ